MLWNIIPAATVILAGLALAADLPAIEISGNKFFYSNNGSQFLMKGVAYQQETNGTTTATFVDPLANFDTCSRDIPYLQELQTNVIRVYALDVTKDHTKCMNALADAGIYVIADLSEPGLSINRDSPAWNLELLGRYTSVVDAFSNYTNVLGFFAGNEVTNVVSNTDASAYVKAAVRDTKAYISEKGYRNIPVGYSANDDSEIRVDLAQYFACGDESEHADFFGINMYEWCGDSTFKTSGYESITNQYKDLGIPIFFSEYGCNKVMPRIFTEVQAIYSTEMTDVWSGGIVYLYFQEENDYGLVSVSGNSVSPLVDFTNLKNQLASISPSFATSLTSASQSVTTCPTVGSDWSAATVLPPTPDSRVCDCMVDSLSCVVDPSVSSENFGDLFSIVCGLVDCSGVSGNATTGKYGTYSPCDAKAKLDFVLNLYYSANGGSKSACDFSGSASLKSATTSSSCKAVLSSAGVSGTGSISGSIATQATTTSTATGKGKGTATSTATGKGTAETKSGSNSGSSETSSSSDKKSDASKVSTFSSVSAAIMLVSCMAVGLGLVFA